MGGETKEYYNIFLQCKASRPAGIFCKSSLIFLTALNQPFKICVFKEHKTRKQKVSFLIKTVVDGKQTITIIIIIID